MYDDQELISRILAGNLHAFRLLVARHERLVHAITARVLVNQADVEDVGQEVFIRVHRYLPRFRFESSLSTWIGQIAYTTALNHLKKKGNRHVELNDAEFLAAPLEEDLVIRKSTAAFIQQEVARLPEQYRLVLTLYHLQELSYEEIGQITGMPEGTVKNYLFRARKLLKARLSKFKGML